MQPVYNQGPYDYCGIYCVAQILKQSMDLFRCNIIEYFDCEQNTENLCMNEDCVGNIPPSQISHYFKLNLKDEILCVCNHCMTASRMIEFKQRPAITVCDIVDYLKQKIGEGADIQMIHAAAPQLILYDVEHGEKCGPQWHFHTKYRPTIASKPATAKSEAIKAWSDVIACFPNMIHRDLEKDKLKLFCILVAGESLQYPDASKPSKHHIMPVKVIKKDGSCIAINCWGNYLEYYRIS